MAQVRDGGLRAALSRVPLGSPSVDSPRPRSIVPVILMAAGIAVLAVAGLRTVSMLRGGSQTETAADLSTPCVTTACKVNADIRPARGYEAPSVAVDPSDPNHVVAADVNLVGGQCGWHVTFDGGKSWEDGIFELPQGYRACGLDGGGFIPFGGVAAGPSGTLYAVMDSAPAGEGGLPAEGESILVATSTDGGRTFGPARVAVRPPAGVAFQRPTFSVSAGSDGKDRLLLSFWGCAESRCTEARFAQSFDGGETFSGPVLVNEPPGGNSPSAPVLGPDGGVYMTFLRRFQGGEADIQIAWSEDGSSFTSNRVDRRQGVGGRYDSAKLLADPERKTLYIAWNDESLGTTNVFFRASSDRGATWSQPLQVNRSLGPTHYSPVVSLAPDGRIDVVYHRRAAGELDDVDWAYSLDGGSTFSPIRQLNDRSINRAIGYWEEVGNFYPPAVASLPGRAYAAWSDTRFGTRATDNQDTMLRIVEVPAGG